MAKILTDQELLDILRRAVDREVLADDPYDKLLQSLGEVVTEYFGGTLGSVSYGNDIGWCIVVHIDEAVPKDGGVYARYDTDVTWKNGEELE